MSEKSLEEALDYVAADYRKMILDSIHAQLFNTANSLLGNTEEHDLEWLAREIYTDAGHERPWYDSLTNEEKEHWRTIARASLRALVGLTRRIADRCQLQAKVVEQLLREDTKARKGHR